MSQFLLFSAIKAVAVFGAVMTMFAYGVLVERRVAAFIQDRVARTASVLLVCYSHSPTA